MTYSKAINMAISAISMDTNLSLAKKQDIIETLAYVEESAVIGLAFQKYGGHFNIDVDLMIDYAEEQDAEKESEAI